MSKRDSNGEKEEKAGLDLGLASLLSLQSDGAPHTPPSRSEEPQKDPPVPQELSPLGTLAAELNWDELLKVSEYQLTVSQSTEARAWWVYAHLMRKSMPAAFLAAPFENLLLGTLSEITDSDRNLLSKVGSLLVDRLTQAGEKGLASVIREKLIAQNLSCTSEGIESEPQRMNEAAHLANMTGLQHLVTQASVEPVSTLGKSQTALSTISPAKKSSRTRLALGGACAACVVLGFVIFYRAELANLTSLPVSVASEQFYSAPKEVELLNPELKRRDVVGSLTALFYSIDKTPVADGDASFPTQPSPPSEVAAPQGKSQPALTNPPSSSMPSTAPGQIDPPTLAQIPASDSTAKQAPSDQTSSLQSSAPTGVERVKVDGPIEPPSVRERIQGRRQLPKLPNIERVPREPEKESKSAGKDKNSPFGKTPREEIVMGIPEPDLNDGIRYQVMTRTTVLSDPHYSATTVGRLLPGDIIIVERKIGEWLKLRSVKGRPGYVLAKDVAGAPYEEYRR